MIFTDKIPSGHQRGVVYQNLQSCCLRLDYALTSTPSIHNPLSSAASHLLKCSTVYRYHQGRGLDESVEGPSKYTHNSFLNCCCDGQTMVEIFHSITHAVNSLLLETFYHEINLHFFEGPITMLFSSFSNHAHGRFCHASNVPCSLLGIHLFL